MKKIGLVTVLYNSDDVLAGFFSSLAVQTYTNFTLYIVDNSVNDTTNDLLARYFQHYPQLDCRHIKSEGNIGVAAGNNVGIYQALADDCAAVVLLNNDIEIEQAYLLASMAYIWARQQEVMIVPKILYYSDRKIWMAGGWLDKVRALGVHYGMDKADAPEYNVAKHITYAPTCFMLVDKTVFESIGFMDEKYFAYYDDTDFVLRAIEHGFKLYYEPTLWLLHKVSSSAGTNSPFYVYYSNRNKVYFIRKNFSGMRKYFALLYTLVSRIVFWIKLDAPRRKKLVAGLKDGFRLKVDPGSL